MNFDDIVAKCPLVYFFNKAKLGARGQIDEGIKTVGLLLLNKCCSFPSIKFSGQHLDEDTVLTRSTLIICFLDEETGT